MVISYKAENYYIYVKILGSSILQLSNDSFVMNKKPIN